MAPTPASAAEERPGAPGERERHQQLRRRVAEPDRQDHHDRQEGGHRGVEVDGGGEDGDEHHEEDQELGSAAAGPGDHELADLGGHARRLEGGAHHEQGGDEGDRGVPEAPQGLGEREEAGGPEGERRGQRHDHHREPVPDEEHHEGRDDQIDQRDIAQRTSPEVDPSRMAPPTSWRSPR
jgi:hypothetical protein